jgi:outer membrane protein OmpA-like peptidoglycan-associated protein
MRCLLLSLVLLLSAVPAFAWQEGDTPSDVEGAKDHPTVPRFPKSFITDSESKEFDEYALPLRWDAETGEWVTRRVEGRYTRLVYDNFAKVSAAEIVGNYKNALTKAGFAILLEMKDSPDKRYLSAERTGTTPAWVYIATTNENNAIRVDLYIVEGKAMEQKIEMDAAGMLAELNAGGKVAIYGIQFDTAKASIRPESAAVLGEVAKLLAAHPTLRLRIEGHTDNEGKAATNLDLSRKRAASVRDWLVAKGKATATRLVTDGFGDTRPVGDNGTDAGRAKNRRVELVKL